ncbi:hypothetical protein ACWYXJ_29250 [Janthinobacterium lividum]|uniref:hypothetical protein n=1 Tax=Janthinobacterium sp. UMAB-56 TaxID=1365361 RepID=UPI001C58A593|nr:hypothetical protein [Janthinobacterium sp. UMAB-56]
MKKKLKTLALLRPGELIFFVVLLVVTLTFVPGLIFKALLVVCIIITAAICQRKNLRMQKEQAGFLEYIRIRH